MSGLRKPQGFILWDGEPAAGCPLCSGPRTQWVSQHRGTGSQKRPGQDEVLWSTTESDDGLEFPSSFCLVNGWEVYFLVFLFFLSFFLWRLNKCILESFSELMLRGFFITGTVTRDIANWFFCWGEITFHCVSGQKCPDDFFWNLIKSSVVIGLFTSLKVSFQG